MAKQNDLDVLRIGVDEQQTAIATMNRREPMSSNASPKKLYANARGVSPPITASV